MRDQEHIEKDKKEEQEQDMEVDAEDINIELDNTQQVQEKNNEDDNQNLDKQQKESDENKSPKEEEKLQPKEETKNELNSENEGESPKSVEADPKFPDFIEEGKSEGEDKEGEDNSSIGDKSVVENTSEVQKSDSADSIRLNRRSENGDEEVDMDVDSPPVENSDEEEIIVENDEDIPLEEELKRLLYELADSSVERTEERRELMTNLEERRKKWILWGKQKAKEANEKATKRKVWNVENKKVFVRKELENVFQNFEKAITEGNRNSEDLLDEDFSPQGNRSYLDIEKNDDIIVPLNLAIFQNIHIPILNQAKIINRACIHLFFRKLELLKHLENIRKIFF